MRTSHLPLRPLRANAYRRRATLLERECENLRSELGALRGIAAALRQQEAQRRAALCARLAHEINTPLQAINNILFLARHDKAQASLYMDMAVAELRRIADVLQALQQSPPPHE